MVYLKIEYKKTWTEKEIGKKKWKWIWPIVTIRFYLEIMVAI